MKISEVEELVGITKVNIRYYESEKLILPTHLQNGYRDYTAENVERLKKIRFLRELGFPIDQIRDSIEGNRNLYELAEEQYKRLTEESSQISRAKDVCEKLCKERVTFAGLQPDEYQENWTEKENLLKETAISEDCEPCVAPIRRFLARSMDMAILGAMINVVFLFGFRMNILRFSTLQYIGISLATMLLMFLTEPLLLHFFGTTLGKAMLGLHLEGHDGELPSLESARAWTGGAILAGMGLNMPVIGEICMFLSWRKASKEEFLSWECLDYRMKREEKKRRVGVAVFVFTDILLLAVQFAGLDYMYTPPNRGSLTVEQYAENYNVLRNVYLGKASMTPRMNAKGALDRVQTQKSEFHVSPSPGNMRRQIFYETDGDYISEIRVEVKGSNVFYYDYWDECIQLMTITALSSEKGIGSGITTGKKMQAIHAALKSNGTYVSKNIAVQADVTSSENIWINGTVIQRASGEENSYEVVYTIKFENEDRK